MRWDAYSADPELSILTAGGAIAMTAGAMGLMNQPENLYKNGFLGLMLFLFGLESIVVGRSPTGETGGWKLKAAVGIPLCLTGMITAFLPGTPQTQPTWILFLCLSIGGAVQLLEMLLAEHKYRSWKGQGGPLKLLGPTCGAFYVLSILLGASVKLPQNELSARLPWLVAVAYGISLLGLSRTLQRVRVQYPKPEREKALQFMPADRAMMLIVGIFMSALGIMLIPVSLGLIRFSQDAQLGFLVITMSIQMMATGNTPLGTVAPPALAIPIGIGVSVGGTISCLMPGLLSAPLTLILGILNLAGGIMGLRGLRASRTQALKAMRNAGIPTAPSPLANLWRVQLAMNAISLLFGTSMLIHNLVPGWLIGTILTANGTLLMLMIPLLEQVGKLSRVL